MNCFYHSNRAAVVYCSNCCRGLCRACADRGSNTEDGKILCEDCSRLLRDRQLAEYRYSLKEDINNREAQNEEHKKQRLSAIARLVWSFICVIILFFGFFLAGCFLFKQEYGFTLFFLGVCGLPKGLEIGVKWILAHQSAGTISYSYENERIITWLIRNIFHLILFAIKWGFRLAVISAISIIAAPYLFVKSIVDIVNQIKAIKASKSLAIENTAVIQQHKDILSQGTDDGF